MIPRVAGIDALRGLAVAAMVVYHAAFDLAWFRVTASNFYRDAFWLHSRTIILSSFLLLAGVSLVLAQSSPRGRERFWLHVGRIAACAAAVTAGSYLVFPRSFIWFGVLHAIALSLVLIRPIANRPAIALAAGLAIVVAGNLIASPVFDSRALGWIGFMTGKPITEDYVPLFPWTGVMLIGVAAGHALARHDFAPVAPLARAPALVRWLGRHSLLVYMVHQPLLLGAMWFAVGGVSR
ncbi:MAG: heparan-alpha-glucosaminide N-acetyltransferase [Burkholderiales bacterium]